MERDTGASVQRQLGGTRVLCGQPDSPLAMVLWRFEPAGQADSQRPAAEPAAIPALVNHLFHAQRRLAKFQSAPTGGDQTLLQRIYIPGRIRLDAQPRQRGCIVWPDESQLS